MQSDVSVRNADEEERVETVIIPPVQEESLPVQVILPEETAEPAAEETTAAEPAWSESPPESPVYTWPVSGEVERGYSREALGYDVTMRDWRTHSGLDIAAPLGSTVVAAREGMVESVREDDLFGTVVTVDHGDGTRAVYANLADVPAVQAGDWVGTGGVIGAIGTTAIGEIGQPTHLHFAMTVDGLSADPMDYLPA